MIHASKAFLLTTVLIFVTMPGFASELQPPEKIVNGQWSQGEPSTVLMTSAVGQGFCTGTLVGCKTVITAAHCVQGADPDEIEVFSQHGSERAKVVRIAVHPQFEVAPGADIAVVELESPMAGIVPTPLNDMAEIPPFTSVRKTGFGVILDFSGFGIKRTVTLPTRPCPPDLPNEICYTFTDPRVGGTACFGDSGGPMFADLNGTQHLVGVTSRGSGCSPPAIGIDTSIYTNRTWLNEEIGGDLGSSQCGGPEVGGDDSRILPEQGYLWSASPVDVHSWSVSNEASSLRFSVNASGPVTARFRHGEPPTDTEFDCQFTGADACQVTSPAAGTWFASVAGIGEYQATVTELYPMGSGLGEAGLPAAANPTDFCVNSYTTRCLSGTPLDRRFELQIQFMDPKVGVVQPAYFLPLIGLDGGISYFFESTNPEILAKVLNGCSTNGHYWLFAAAATTLEYELSIRDRKNGTTYRVGNPGNQIAESVADLKAFTCN